MNRKKGSAIVIVVILGITASAYVGSCITMKNSLKINIDRYDRVINKYYSKDLENLSDLYNNLDKLSK